MSKEKRLVYARKYREEHIEYVRIIPTMTNRTLLLPHVKHAINGYIKD